MNGVCVSVHSPHFELCTARARPTSQLGLLVSKSEFGFFWAISVFTVSNRSIHMSFSTSINLESSFLKWLNPVSITLNVDRMAGKYSKANVCFEPLGRNKD